MALPLSRLPTEILREIRTRKWLALFVFAAVSFIVLAVGFLWPYKYQSQVIIFVDDRNIIQPLMEGRAVTTKISEKASAARELLWSRTVMEKIAKDTDVFGDNAENLSQEALAGRVSGIRSGMSVATRGDNYFSIGFSASSPLRAFQVAQKLGQSFIEENSNRKRAESRSAYEFIDKQVKSYERQIAGVEARLQQFLSENVEGTEANANARMANLQSRLELAELEREELQTRANALDRQMAEIDPRIRQGQTLDAYQVRINSMEEQLDALRLRYHDTYPDIIILREQIAELRNQQQRALATQEESPRSFGDMNIANPVYQDIRSTLVTTNTDIETVETRIQSIQRLIAEQTMRMERIQENKTQYSDLTRDLEVNREIYDDLLKRREKARVSMHLDIEGQGLNYRINETAQYPNNPSGPKFSMFALAGLFVGFVAPFGAVAALLQVDPRIRSREQIEDVLELSILEQLPEVRTPFEKRRDRRITLAVSIMAVVVAGAYIAVALAAVLGVF
ncbi:XrtA system polysaccharide chain length determinant [Marinobacter halophilus]|uniref:Lipopolysaccharide biosynthesis protein n=1 Tax=Marinobacter halophilus TaxID=1323740 RepID=A0A2T1K8M6_9GAMM|nr:XrtA system polysaccharide chain length determinant [Marinobacter halophilus]PSF06485.1 lipopolysaccharide biosynthesis protein [Marinobacter halophilus]GGC73013.1 chain-length determining protein [Marinobacter halophilus]